MTGDKEYEEKSSFRPKDFIFRLTSKEYDSLMSQIVISKTGRGGRRKLPLVFTEHGALMAANVLNSKRAVEASVQVVRAFVRMRNLLASNAELAKKIEALERKYDSHFKVVAPLLPEEGWPYSAGVVGARSKD